MHERLGDARLGGDRRHAQPVGPLAYDDAAGGAQDGVDPHTRGTLVRGGMAVLTGAVSCRFRGAARILTDRTVRIQALTTTTHGHASHHGDRREQAPGTAARASARARAGRFRPRGTPIQPSTSSSRSGSSRRSWQYACAGRAGRRARGLHDHAGRARPGRDRARPRRRAARLRQRLPPQRAPRGDRQRAAARRSSARTTPGRTTSTARCAARRGPSASRASTRRTSRCCRSRSTPGARSCSSIPASQRQPLAHGAGRSAPARGRVRHRPVDAAVPLASRVAVGGQLEGRDRELPRVLPLRGRAPGLQQADRRAPRLVPAAPASAPTRARSGRCGPSALDGSGKAPYDPRGDVTQSQFHHVWPNTTINVAPGPQNLSIERWVPTGPTEHGRGDRLLLRRRRDRAADRRTCSSSTLRSGSRTSRSWSPSRQGSTRGRAAGTRDGAERAVARRLPPPRARRVAVGRIQPASSRLADARARPRRVIGALPRRGARAGGSRCVVVSSPCRSTATP